MAAEPIVVDHLTGLTWQDEFGSMMAWSDALSYCDTLAWRGYKWRLPDPYELHSIVDLSLIGQAIDKDFFQSMPTSSPDFWTSSLRGADVVYVSFDLGSVSARPDSDDIWTENPSSLVTGTAASCFDYPATRDIILKRVIGTMLP